MTPSRLDSWIRLLWHSGQFSIAILQKRHLRYLIIFGCGQTGVCTVLDTRARVAGWLCKGEAEHGSFWL
jgi:hypothetical protein